MAWKGLVIVAALAVASWPQVAKAIRLVPEPANPRLGQSVTISVRDTRYPYICFWFRGNAFDKNRMIFQVELGRVVAKRGGFTGRESLGKDCSLVIQNLQPSDNGEFYLIVQEGRLGQTQRWSDALVHLQVS
ncbi:carcinoembryonic antigen-related cell adhesion molecule 6-like [Sceloporus undulatus]|uniref:carcinoembryonic antigen-related cell adhesion molecule 6-like n=1 Tax=Sceloporus undulatus TaxID=8520 RepID=UPI001C4BED26|nr:carcinoembryonic antigen-related cell adhesion molecule 6-like [Sceloporus undulatus]